MTCSSRPERLAHPPDLYLGSATWRSDWSFLVVLLCTTRDMSALFKQAKWRRHGRRALWSLVEDVALMVLIIRLARLTYIYVLSFFLFSVQVAQVFTHISPLFFSRSLFLSQLSPALRIQIGVIFVIGVNELVFLAQRWSSKHLDNDVQLER